jgi:predicted cobalt transporter CbtA
MVEYAVLVAGTGLRSLAADLTNFANGLNLNWGMAGYAALMLVALRIAFWAFSPSR